MTSTPFLFGQKQGNIWYFGQNAGLDFNTGEPIPLTDGKINQWEGCASIANSNGQLLFYTDGIHVWNRKHQQMPNGFNLNGHPSSTQSGVVIPKPGNNNIYYIFTVDNNTGAKGLCYSVVDMQLDNGLGDIISDKKNIPIFTPSTEKIAAVIHANKSDFWVLTHLWSSNQFNAYRITENGVDTENPVISNVGIIHQGKLGNSRGYMKSSPDGSKIAVAIEGIGKYQLFDFNNATGQLSNPVDFPDIYPSAYGVEFSPNGRFLYGSERWGNKIHQFDIQASDIPASETVVATLSSNNGGALQLATDGKIYLARNQKDYLGVIHQPNEAALNCQYEDNGAYLEGKKSKEGLPTFIASFFNNAAFRYDKICLNQPTQFSILNNTNEIQSMEWFFNYPSETPEETSTELNPQHTYTSTGTYEVMLIAHGTETTDTASQTLEVMHLPQVDLGDNRNICEYTKLDAGAGFASYKWSDGSDKQYLTVTNPGNYSVAVIDENGCYASDEITVGINPLPEIEYSVKNAMTIGGNEGEIDITVTAGLAPFSYQWSNGETTQDVYNLTADIYQCMVTDNNNCQKNEFIKVTGPIDCSEVEGWEWAKITTDAFLFFEAGGISIENSENFIYMTGTSAISSTSSYPLYITKYSKSGEQQWFQRFEVSEFAYTENIVTDNNNDIYIVGYFEGTLIIDSDTLIAETNQLNNMFIAKLNSDGEVQWTKQFGSTENDFAHDIAIDNNNNLLICGVVKGTVDFDGFQIEAGNISQRFVLKCTENGIVQWVKIISGTVEAEKPFLDVDSQGNIYIASSFQADIDYQSAGVYSNNVDVFLLKLNTNGDLVWLTGAGGTTMVPDRVQYINVDDNGNVLITGKYSDDMIFDSHTLNSNGSTDAFLAKYNTNGNCIWAKSIGGTNNDEGFSAAVDKTGDIYATGIYKAPLSIADSTLSSYGGQDIYLAKFTSFGDFQWITNVGGASVEYPKGIIIDSKNNLYLGFNTLSDEMNFDTLQINKTSSISNDGLAKYSVQAFQVSLDDYFSDCKPETGNITLSVKNGKEPYSFDWSNGETSQNLYDVSAGTYKVIVKDDNECLTMDSITVTEPVPLHLSIQSNDVSVRGASDGSAILTVQGGKEPYSFSWSNGEITKDLIGIPEGAYTVETVDINGCASTSSAVISAPDTPISLSFDTNLTCANGNDGSIDLTIGGGTPPYTIQWKKDGENFANQQDLQNISAGKYYVVVSDNLFSEGAIVEVTGTNPAPTVNLGDNINHCGKETFTLDAGDDFEQYLWNNNAATQKLDVSVTGVYSVKVTDENSCSATDEIKIEIHPLPLVDLGEDKTIAQGESIILDAGLHNNCDFLWSPRGETSRTITVSEQGIYSVTVTDKNTGCSATDQIVITSDLNNGLVGYYSFCGCNANDNSGNGNHGTLVGNPECISGIRGEGFLFNQNPGDNGCGQPGGQYIQLPQFDAIWEDGVTFAAWTRFDHIAYYERIVDLGDNASGYPAVWFGRMGNTNDLALESWTVGDPAIDRTTGRLVAHNVVTNGEIEFYCATIKGDSMKIYVNGELVAGKKGHSIANVPRSTNFIGRSNWCHFDPDFKGFMDEVRIYNRPLTAAEIRQLYHESPLITVTGNDTICGGAQVQLQATGADSYIWHPGELLNDSTIANPIATISQTTEFACEATLPDGCTFIDTLTVYVFSKPDINLSDTIIECAGLPVILDAGDNFSSFEWNTGETTQSIEITTSGTYSVTVLDQNGCYGSDEVVVEFATPPEQRANIWLFGNRAGLDFRTIPPNAITGSAMNTFEGCASISNKYGNLLFYTDGQTVWGDNNSPILNGTGLNGHNSSTQSGIIVPKPDSENIYYVFTVDWANGSNGLSYSVVDMEANSGNGEVIEKNTSLLPASTERITAVKHENGADIWVVAHEQNSDAFHAYLVSASGVNATPVISHTGTEHIGTYAEFIGYIKASNNGKKIGLCNYGLHFIEIFDFNNATGQLSNPVKFSPYNNPYGIEFSPDNSKLYVLTHFDKRLLQFDLQAGDETAVKNSETLIATIDGDKGGALQLGPDGKIYVAKENSEYLGVINKPNNPGGNCDYDDNQIYLAGQKSRLGLPTLISSMLKGKDFTYQNTCIGETVHFSITDDTDIKSVSWNFGDGAVSSQLEPSYMYDSEGVYEVKLIIDGTCETNTVIKTVTIYPVPDIELEEQINECNGYNIHLEVTSGYDNYLWSDNSTLNYLDVSVTDTYSVTVTDVHGCQTSAQSLVVFEDCDFDFTYSGECFGSKTRFEFSNPLVIESPEWNFGDPLTGDENTADSITTYHYFSAPGIYTTSLTFTYHGVEQTVIQNIEIFPSPKPNLGMDVQMQPDIYFYYLPEGSSVTLNPGTFEHYLWQDDSEAPVYEVNSSGEYSVTVTNQYGCSGFDKVRIKIQDPDIGFYDIESNSPYHCADTLDLTAFNRIDAGGYITPGFTITIRTDINSPDENEVHFYKNNEYYTTFGSGFIPYNGKFLIQREYATPSNIWSFDWCDAIPNGTFPYIVQNHTTTEILERNTADNNSNSCFSSGAFSANGIAVFSGNGVVNFSNGKGKFIAAEAGPGMHEITYCWDNEAGFSGCATQTVEVITPMADAGENKQICIGASTEIGGSPAAYGGAGNYIYSWNPGIGLDNPASPNPIASPTVTTHYTLTVTDNSGKGCSMTDDVTVTVVPVPTASNCDLDACFDVGKKLYPNPQGGSENYTHHQWSGDTQYLSETNVQNPVFKAAQHGDFQLMYTVTDDKGCQGTSVVNVTVNPKPVVDLGEDYTICIDGTTTLDAGAGYENYQWNTGETGQLITVSSKGIYSVEVTDDKGCKGTDAIEITNYPEPQIVSETIQNPLCYQANDGRIVVEADGTPLLRYALFNESGNPVYDYRGNGIFNDLPEGKYLLKIRDGYYCHYEVMNYELVSPPDISITDEIVSQITCYGADNAKIEIHAEGGTGDLSYRVNDDMFQAGNIIEGLPPGEYTVSVIDENNCIKNSEITHTITEPEMLSITGEMSENISCFNANDGKITVEAKGGTGILQYKINNGEYQTDGVFENLTQGNYQITIKDENDCEMVSNRIHQITNPDEIQIIDENTESLKCFGDKNGKISINAIGGTGKLTYTLNSGEAQETGDFKGLSAGNYQLTIKDDNACELSKEYQINSPAQIRIESETLSPTSCHNAYDASITAEASGGTGELHYRINSGIYQDNGIFNHLTEGEYRIMVKDNNHCEVISQQKHIVVNPSPLEIEAEILQQITCFGENDGQIQANASGGTGQLQYRLNDGSYSDKTLFSELSEGSYTIFVKDEHECTKITDTEYQIVKPPQIFISDKKITPLSCHNGQSATIEIDAQGGTGKLFFALNDNSYSIENKFFGLSAGTYQISIRDENDCQLQSPEYNIENPAAIEITNETKTESLCYGDGKAAIDVEAQGGTGTLYYRLNYDEYQTSGHFEALSDGEYKVTVKDENNCKTISEMTHSITNPSAIEISKVDVKQITCHNDADGEITVYASGGTGELLYQLNNGSFQTNNTFTGLDENYYQIKVKDENGCVYKRQASYKISNPVEIYEQSINIQNVLCYGDETGQISVKAAGGNGNFIYRIENGEWQSNGTFTNLASDNYTIEIQDDTGCQDEWTYFVGQPAQPLHIEITDTAMCCYGKQNGMFSYRLSGGTPEYSVQISAENNSPVENPEALFADIYTVYAIDAHQCEYSTQVEIQNIDCTSAIELPNVFTPNNDGENDVYYVKTRNLWHFRVIIHNRWGHVVYESYSEAEGWNGKIRNTNNDAADGVYYIEVYGNGIDGKSYHKNGFLYLMR